MSLWRLTRTRTRLKAARAEIGDIRICDDDISALTMEILSILGDVIKLLDKRIAKAKEQGK